MKVRLAIDEIKGKKKNEGDRETVKEKSFFKFREELFIKNMIRINKNRQQPKNKRGQKRGGNWAARKGKTKFTRSWKKGRLWS